MNSITVYLSDGRCVTVRADKIEADTYAHSNYTLFAGEQIVARFYGAVGYVIE